MTEQPLFQQVVTTLLAGEVICEYSHDKLYNHLSYEANRQRVQAFLGQIGRTLRQTSTHDAWLCVYDDINDPSVAATIRQQFSAVANDLEPLVQFLRLVMATEGTQRPLEPGTHLDEGTILNQLTSIPSLESKLRSLTASQLFRTTKNDSAGQLRHVMGVLAKNGYLKRIGTSGSLYQATGKWSWLYDVMTFIQTHEGIETDEDPDNAQMTMV